MRKELFNLYLDQEDFDFITKISKETGLSKSFIVRRLVTKWRCDMLEKKEQKGAGQNGEDKVSDL